MSNMFEKADIEKKQETASHISLIKIAKVKKGQDGLVGKALILKPGT